MSSPLHSPQDDWNAHWDHYAESARLNPARRMRHDLIARLLCQTAVNSTARVFDLGSGQGDEQAAYAVERIYLTGFPFFNLYRLVVIARGKRLTQDAETQSSGTSSGWARGAMKLFGLLFRLNLPDSPFGWQVVAVVRKTSP